VEEVLQQVDNEYSMFNEESTVSKFNHNQPVSLSPMFLRVFRQAQEVSAETDGAFDVTVAPLVNAWGFGFKQQQMPSSAQVDSLLQLVGMRKLKYDEQKGTIEKSLPGMMLDFSAIAKGFGVDMVAQLLRQRGVQNFMVEIGGEVVAHGISPNRVPWRIGVTKPTDDSLSTKGELQTVLNVTDMAMATSGNYRNFYYKGGRKYAHTIDPRSGYPVQHSLLSATVLAKDCATADAYATSFMVLGIDGAKAVLERHPELMAYFIYTDAQGQLATWYSPSLEDKIAE
jgi:thiamine biosynthesis lipoprotein